MLRREGEGGRRIQMFLIRGDDKVDDGHGRGVQELTALGLLGPRSNI